MGCRVCADDEPWVCWPPWPLLQDFPYLGTRRSSPSRRMVTVLCSSPEFWLFYRSAVAHNTRDTPAAEHAAKIRARREESGTHGSRRRFTTFTTSLFPRHDDGSSPNLAFTIEKKPVKLEEQTAACATRLHVSLDSGSVDVGATWIARDVY